MLKPKILSVSGFRGITRTQRLDFQKPLVLFFGENHQGKSSLVNSLEWAVYGSACSGIDTGIRERVDWEVANRHLDPHQVDVKLELADDSGAYLVHRRLTRRGRRAILQEELSLTLPDGSRLENDEATKKLFVLVSGSFRDFASTVYQHQEAIRAVLTQKPQERNDAIDRLLGLSDYRNLQAGIEAAKTAALQKDLERSVDAYMAKIDVALRTRENDLHAKRTNALDNGLALADLSEEGALVVARRVLNALIGFVAEAKLPCPTCALPTTSKDIKSFRKALRSEIDHARSALPESKFQTQLMQQRAEYLSNLSSYQGQRHGRELASKAVIDFEKKHGTEADVQSRLRIVASQRIKEEGRQRQANARARLVREAIDYLENSGITGPESPCPLCGTDSANPLLRLRCEWEQVVGGQVQEIEAVLAELKKENDGLEQLARERMRLVRDLTEAENHLAVARTQVGKALRKELAADDDPVALLGRELDRIKTELDELEQALLSKQTKLREVGDELDRLGVVHEILELEEKGNVIEQIRSSPEFRRLETLRDDLAEFVGDVGQIKAAASKAATGEAQDRLTAAEQAIDGYFRRIIDNPAIGRLRLSVRADARTGRNAYDLTDHEGRDLVSVLSQGDMNALALAVFLGLACTAGDANRFGFVMLDDPSQSLGSRHKAQLAEVLSEVVAKKTVILSTMDVELRQLLAAKITKEGQTFMFSNWTQEDGPTIVPV